MIGVAGMGLLGTYIMHFIENGSWGGRSFFGALLFFPVLLFPIALLCRVSLLDLLDYATPPGLLLLAFYKYNCYTDGCCAGRTLWFTEEGVPVHFPSQLAEMGVAIVLALCLFLVERKSKFRHKIYPICIVIYGATRFILNHLRWEQQAFLLGLTAGAFWSLVAVLIGVVWLAIARKKQERSEACTTTQSEDCMEEMA